MNFKDMIPWDILDAPVPENFFGEDAKRANLIRHGIKNGVIVQSRVLEELKKKDPDSYLSPKAKYKGKVSKKIAWIEEFYFPKCMKQIKWFEQKWGNDIRLTIKKFEQMKNVVATSTAQKEDKKGHYPGGIKEEF